MNRQEFNKKLRGFGLNNLKLIAELSIMYFVAKLSLQMFALVIGSVLIISLCMALIKSTTVDK